MYKSPLVSIIIVNWNGGQIFNNCLRSLSRLKYPNFELIIVDNASQDSSQNLYKKFASLASKTILIKNDQNLGFAPANNQGALRARGKYILLLNNDTKVPSNFLKSMVNKMETDQTIGAMQPKIFLMAQANLLDNAGSFLTNTGFLEHWGFMKKDSLEYSTERDIFSAKGACLLTRKKIINQVGLFDDDFVSYFEETDFCWRIWLAGFRVIYYPNSFIYHMLGQTSKKMNQYEVNYNSFKNRLRSLYKNLEVKNLVKIFGLHLTIYIGLIVYYLAKLQFKKASMIWRSIIWNVVNFRQTNQKRQLVQKRRKVNDDKILSSLMHSTNIFDMLNHFQKVESNFK